MTKDEIIRMAVQCQLVTTSNRDGVYINALESFANLVISARIMEVLAVERTNIIEQIIGLLESQHEFSKHTHNYWLVAANLIRAEFCDGKKAAHHIKGEA